MHGKAVREAWLQSIRDNAAPAQPIPAAEVPKRLAVLAERRHELEVREEATILSAAARGIALDRRETADPDIVLRVVLADEAA